jgi:hypothetical protein|tara:strand:- start:1552 stop:1662 length:111 start_codon:yes stop_codon:yes gene_type:complete
MGTNRQKKKDSDFAKELKSKKRKKELDLREKRIIKK